MESNFNERLKTGDAETGAKAQNKGRFALALSGGGFRASFFHIGVLAALADLGILHKIEVISGVSGGSIIAAYYYLKVKEKLKENWDKYQNTNLKENEKIKLENKIRNDFRFLVTEIEKEFLKDVQKNIRTRIFFNPFKNLKMSYSSKYSRSDRISELYDRHFYGDKKTEMKEMKIPKECSEYSPLRQNDSNIFKVPILKINATTLNTGHNWTVEAKHMGEPPRDSDMEIAADKNMRLRRPPSWDETASSQDDFRLSDAVAASACVPGLFHPMAVSNMYEDFPINGKIEKITPQLVDGGVHDNLGIAALSDLKVEITNEQGKKEERDYCENIIISDASGQMEDDPDPSTNILKVIGRMNSILMDRVREEELFRLFEQCDKPPKKFAFMHLRKKLPRREVIYLDQKDKPGDKESPARPYLDTPEDFGVPPEVQEHLSRFRTDLDSFTDVEAQSLMLDAYLMSIQEIEKRFKILNLGEENTDISRIEEEIKKSGWDKSEKDWDFKAVQPIFNELIDKNKDGYIPGKEKYKTRKYLKHLKTAGKTTFKVFFLSPFKAFASLVGIYFIPIIALIWLFRDNIANQISAFLARSVEDFVPGLIVAAVGFVLGLISPFFRWLKRTLPKGTFKILLKSMNVAGKGSRIWIHLFTRFLWPTLGWLFVFFHLLVFDCYFKKSGKFEKFLKTL